VLGERRIFTAASITIVAILFFVFIAYWFSANQSTKKRVPNYQQERIVRFSYELANTTNQAINDAGFSTYLPVNITANQKVLKLESKSIYETEAAENGNRVAHFKVGLIPPFGKKKVQFTSVLSMAESPNELDLLSPSIYLGKEKYIEVDHEKIIKLAARLRGETDSESIEKIYKWVSSRIKDSGYTSQDRGALYALNSLKGDCTEHMYLVIALSRALSIPARGIGGYVYETNKVAKPADYHNWAEVFVDGEWLIVDSQKRSFRENIEDYIAMRIISSSGVDLLGSSHRFLVANQGVKVSMN